MLSFWEYTAFVNYDYIVAGGGLTGLVTAITLRKNEPEKTVALLESGIFPAGASTKNAGFACFGSLSELVANRTIIGDEKLLNLVSARWAGLNLLRNLVPDTIMEYECNGGYELLNAESLSCLNSLDEINKLLEPVFGQKVYELKDTEKISGFRFNQGYVKSLVFNRFEGQLHPGKMMRYLGLLARRLGVETYSGAEVISVNETCKGVEVRLCAGKDDNGPVLHATKLALCTNGFSSRLVAKPVIWPGRGIVLLTTPLKHLPFKGTFHLDEGFYYFRDYQNRVLFGGGRNLYLEEETTTDFAINKKIYSRLLEMLQEIIIPGMDFRVEYSWAGIMAFTETNLPVIQKTGENIYTGAGMNGMGVALGSLAGSYLGELMTGNNPDENNPLKRLLA